MAMLFFVLKTHISKLHLVEFSASSFPVKTTDYKTAMYDVIAVGEDEQVITSHFKQAAQMSKIGCQKDQSNSHQVDKQGQCMASKHIIINLEGKTSNDCILPLPYKFSTRILMESPGKTLPMRRWRA
jgi:hypothetical protein